MSTNQLRHEVISIPFTDDRLALLERHRAVLTAKLDRDVSLAEAAALVFEDRAPELDRATARLELLQTPTASLDRIRKRWASEHALSPAEWDVLADYVLISTETARPESPLLCPAIPSRASYLALLDAFDVVYQHRAHAISTHAWAYVSHLGGTGWFDADAQKRQQAVLNQIAECRARLQSEDAWFRPGDIGRCLWMAMRDEGIDRTTLDRILAPSWPALWGLAARGHWLRHQHRPVRPAGPMHDDVRQHLRLPEPMTTGDLTLAFEGIGRPELAMVVHAGPARRSTVVLVGYPELMDFRAMLDNVGDPGHSRHFSTLVTLDLGQAIFSLSRKASDEWLTLTETEWRALRDLFRDAWRRPEIACWLSELAQEYGEQG
jgi:hypothetical protein